jgi:hypothetical protein
LKMRSDGDELVPKRLRPTGMARQRRRQYEPREQQRAEELARRPERRQQQPAAGAGRGGQQPGAGRHQPGAGLRQQTRRQGLMNFANIRREAQRMTMQRHMYQRQQALTQQSDVLNDEEVDRFAAMRRRFRMGDDDAVV